MNDKYVLGIDIGGSHITAAILDMENRSILEQSYSRAKINSGADSDYILKAWSAVINEAYQKAGLDLGKIGIAMPGPFDYEKGISYITGTNKYEALYNLNVKDLLADELKIDTNDIRLKNDASCFLAGEEFAGAGKGYHKIIGLTLGTGLGTAVFEDGVSNDANLWCAPFLESIAEDYLSTRWFLKRYYDLSGLNIVDVKEMTSLYAESETVRQIFEEFSINLAAFIYSFQQQTQADAVVIGGNIAKAADRFLPGVNRQLKKKELSLPIHISLLNEHAALAGAASCWHH